MRGGDHVHWVVKFSTSESLPEAFVTVRVTLTVVTWPDDLVPIGMEIVPFDFEDVLLVAPTLNDQW